MKQFITYLDDSGSHDRQGWPASHSTQTCSHSRRAKPTNIGKLRSFIGLIIFYEKFIPRQATIMAPLCALLQNNAKWVWADEQKRAFEDAKRAFMEPSVLVHFDNKLPSVLSCDACATGVSCVLAHVINNEESPVLFISRTLSTAE